MTILSKDALDKIRKERAILNGNNSTDVDELFGQLEKAHQKSKHGKQEQENDKYELFEDGDFYSLDPNKK